MTKVTAAERDEARAELRALLPVGSTVYTDVKHVSRSGMSRVIGLHVAVLDRDGQPAIRDITWLASQALGWSMDRDRHGLRVGGAGMDMAFHAVYSLSRALYPDGHRCSGKGTTPTGRKAKAPRCPSNDHSNDYGALSREFADAHPELASAEYAEGLTPEERHAARVEYVSARAEWMDSQEAKLWSRSRVHRDGGYALRKAAI